MASTLKPNCISQDTAILAIPPSLILCVPSALITALPTPPSALTLANPIVLDPTVSAVSPNDIEVPAIVIAAPSGISVWPSIMKPSISSPEAGVGNAKAVPSTTMPEEARLITLPDSVMGGPPMERVVPPIAIVLGERGVSVSPCAVITPSKPPMANENVEPIITIAEELAARLIGVPDIVIAEEPGVRVWLSSRYLPTGSAVSVWASSSRTELAWAEAVESEIVEEPMMI
ncbi:hypothetical protein OEA41_004789 [Lepraria neglecta]|uniref:Uncharacterized protein n=1 Tax=Lepraria neglecta TaxID=209136 RepID=A0AAE0DEV8_9LECA|nr:hypothetical protein OEA41_004789 [Lepraria neglecta]